MPGRLYLCIQTITKVESRYICISFAHVSYFTFWKFVIKMSLFYLLFLFCYLNAKNQFKVTKGCKKSDTLHWPFCSFIFYSKFWIVIQQNSPTRWSFDLKISMTCRCESYHGGLRCTKFVCIQIVDTKICNTNYLF